MLIVDGKLKQWNAVDGIEPELMEYDDLFADMGIGRGILEYERAKNLLASDRTIENWQVLLKELARWCEI